MKVKYQTDCEEGGENDSRIECNRGYHKQTLKYIRSWKEEFHKNEEGKREKKEILLADDNKMEN